MAFFDGDSLWIFSLIKQDVEKDDEDEGGGDERDVEHTKDDEDDDADDDDDVVVGDSEVESQSDATTKESFVKEFSGVDFFCAEILDEQIARDSRSIDKQLEPVAL